MKLWIYGLALVLVGAPVSASAQDVEDIRWITMPDAELSSQMLPRFAAMLGVSATVILQCRIESDGHPLNCRVLDETVHGLGFGSAARAVVASGEIRAKRINGRPVGGSFRTRVMFTAPPIEAADAPYTVGPKIPDEALRLARTLLSQDDEDDEYAGDSDRMDGLDYDRRTVVGAWMDELMPMSPEQRMEIRATQLANLFSIAELKRMIAGEKVDMPSEEEFDAACPPMTPADRAAVLELRRRYCGQYEC